MREKREISGMLRLLAQAIEDMPESEYEQLLNGTGLLAFKAIEAKKEKSRLSAGSKISTEELQLLITELQECKSREEVRNLIHKDPRVPLRDNLEQLAKLIKVHVNKHDKREAIEDKIVESVIGVKLRSEAILGLNLKSSGSQQDDA